MRNVVCHLTTASKCAEHLTSLRRRCIRRRVLRVALLSVLPVAVVFVVCVHWYYVYSQMESPLDHLPSNLLKPFYRFQCPIMSQKKDCSLPKLLMVSARPLDRRLAAYSSWLPYQVVFINTTAWSREFARTGECSEESFPNRLFYVYKGVFRTVLADYDDEKDFIFVEDDVQLLDFDKLHSETCSARENNLQFFSFFRPKSQGKSCVYEHGTVAFYISREMMEQLVEVDKRVYCRLPIDMYIAARGPWFSTRQDIVKHTGKKRYQLPITVD